MRILGKRLTERDIGVIRERLGAGESQGKVAKSYGVTRQQIGRIGAGLSWPVVEPGADVEARGYDAEPGHGGETYGDE